jgi:tRNA(Arg) A34 adenosine deaminase TadA
VYFGNYTRLVYLAQKPEAGAIEEAMDIAARLNLNFEYRATGYGDLEKSLTRFSQFEQNIVWQR